MRNRFYKYPFYTFCFTIPLSQLVSSRLLLVMALLSIFLSIKNFPFSSFLYQSWDLLLFFLILAGGLIYSSDIDLGVRQLETNLSLIGLPIAITCLPNFSKQRLDQVFYFFAVGLLAASFICLASAVVSYTHTGDLQAFFYGALTRSIDLDPTYFAYYLIFAITYGLYLLYYELPKRYTIWMIGLVIFFFLILMLTGGQTVFISMLLIFSFFISKYTLEKKSKRESVSVSLVTILLVCMVGLTIVFQGGDQFRSISNQNDYWERMSLWESAILANSNPLLGVGTGDYSLVLNDYYRTHNLTNFAMANFNSHNQFIQSYLSNGIIGLIGLLIILLRPIYLSVKNQNMLGILLLFPFIVYGVTEVFLSRYQGVIFFALVHQLIVSNALSTKSIFSLGIQKF
ncbi:MAG: O-antigen ligase family protein [Chryseotalea sp. WA131a]|nr:MAG: O-antigen ligase family protein [Chryseotalea sp. WA131a]